MVIKRKTRTFKVVPEAIRLPSGTVADELGLPSRRGSARIVIGRHEWLSLPELGVFPLDAKVDTGARTSCLHAEEIDLDVEAGRVRFVTRDHHGKRISCEAQAVGNSRVRTAGGTAHPRIFIRTTALFSGGFRWSVLFTLADRAVMRCPVLLGRRALAGFFLIDPQGNHLLGGLRDFEFPGAPGTTAP